MGIGLTISRDIAKRSGGDVWVGSGDAWLQNPGLPSEAAGRIPLWQGSMLNFELHRAGLITFNVRDLFAQYEKANSSPAVRFLF